MDVLACRLGDRGEYRFMEEDSGVVEGVTEVWYCGLEALVVQVNEGCDGRLGFP